MRLCRILIVQLCGFAALISNGHAALPHLRSTANAALPHIKMRSMVLFFADTGMFTKARNDFQHKMHLKPSGAKVESGVGL